MSSGWPDIQRDFLEAKSKQPPVGNAGGFRRPHAARNVPNEFGKTLPAPLVPEFRWNFRHQQICLTRIEPPKGSPVPVHEKSHVLMMNILGKVRCASDSERAGVWRARLQPHCQGRVYSIVPGMVGLRSRPATLEVRVIEVSLPEKSGDSQLEVRQISCSTRIHLRSLSGLRFTREHGRLPKSMSKQILSREYARIVAALARPLARASMLRCSNMLTGWSQTSAPAGIPSRPGSPTKSPPCRFIAAALDDPLFAKSLSPYGWPGGQMAQISKAQLVHFTNNLIILNVGAAGRTGPGRLHG